MAALVRGEPFDENLSDKLMLLVKQGRLPFHAVTSNDLGVPRPGDPDPPRAGKFSSPDALLTPSYMAEAARDPGIRIEPAWKVSVVYGMPCAIYHQLPAAYYLAARFSDNFELAVLHAINGGGQNMARACLTGALVGAQVGLSGIPKRLVEGLQGHEELVSLCQTLGYLAERIGWPPGRARGFPGGGLPKSPAIHRATSQNARDVLLNAGRRAEPWPTIDHGSARGLRP